MEKQGFKNGLFLGINGLIFALLGCLLLFFTREEIEKFVFYFGIIVLAAGAILLIAGINGIRKDRSATMPMIQAVAAIAVGLALIFFMKASFALFLMMMGIWAIVIGIVQLVIIVNFRMSPGKKNVFLLSGLLTIALGVSLLFNPFEWAVFMVKIIGSITVLGGAALVYLAVVLRSMRNREIH